MSSPQNRFPIEPFQLSMIGYWVVFWLIGIYWVPLLLLLIGASFDAGSQHNILAGVSTTIVRAAVGGAVLQMLKASLAKKAPSKVNLFLVQALFWGVLWTILFYTDRAGTQCAVGIDSTACSQLHFIGTVILGPVLFLYYAMLGLFSSLLPGLFARR
ncbi:hypothetical protein K9N68_23570 [Kovacikia minuta CCNUW1]|uniref:hypothetical protein n=1 Tax=Kovacikia minuta TaxID=2931930 RepID=UPI001CC9EB42|nr:hypothetical protein [Kovacikia minuta]UBF24633.1 hypothetical protein K9N68_23570 [Kovacikia minuta CCNUW1]